MNELSPKIDVIYEPGPSEYDFSKHLPQAHEFRIGSIATVELDGIKRFYVLKDSQREGKYWSPMTETELANARTSGKIPR